MTRKLRYLFVLLLIGVSGSVFAQTGAISGTVYDEMKEPVIGAVVQVFQGGVARGGDVTNEDGKYTVKPLNPGNNFEIHVRYASYKEIRLTNVIVSSDRTTYQNFNMEVNAKQMEEVVVKSYKVPLIKKDEPGTTQTFTADQINKLPTRNTNDAASLAGGTYQSRSGDPVSIAGARSGGTLYIIDGVQVNGAAGTNFPPGSIDQISVVTSGIPAKYGDASGGVISITTRGSSPKHTGEIGYEHSVDGYNHNLAYFSLAGPLLKKRIDSMNRVNVLGYSLSGSYNYTTDDDPNYFDNYVLKADKLREIQERPLEEVINSTGGKSYRSRAESVTMQDVETRKTRINAEYQNARLVGKLDYQINNNMNLVLGGNFNYVNTRQYDPRYALFSPDNMPSNQNYTGRGYVRFTQRFSKPNLDAAETKTPLISNAFYTLQADYSVTYSETQDPKHKKNAFDYGYVGKFDLIYDTTYRPDRDPKTGRSAVFLNSYNTPVGVNFTPSDKNPLLANYTKQYYEFAGNENYPLTLSHIQAGNGLLNGYLPPFVYGSDIFFNSGYARAGYSYSNQEQVAFHVEASFDLQPKKTRHSIEVGLDYQQRSERSYGINAAGPTNGLWQTMRLLANKHLADLDTSNPTYVINGNKYTYEEYLKNGLNLSPFDTVLYNRKYDPIQQSTFDRNLREKLGYDPKGTDILNVDNMDPSTFSLDMFSPDELFVQGNPLVSYYGYDYTGKRINGQVNFNDWFTKKDANGNYVRNVGAFRPNYIAGYIMDKFELPNNTLFNIGVRVDRFDANTKVLKDPYTLYAAHTVGTSNAENPLGKTPDNIGSDYVVYVTDNAAPGAPTVAGYRNGDDWYDPSGKFVADPSILSQGNDIQPHLVKDPQRGQALTMRDEGYDPNTSFTDYKPQVNVMPRVSFTFPIAEQSMFYAHYDVYVMRPKSVGEIYASPLDYYYINTKGSDIIRNPDLKPEKVFDYELGFQQVLTPNSAITLTGFYKERKDMIQVRPYLFAYPNTYYTFGNRDFSTTKGFTLRYDLRRINHLSMNLAYTLQFAEGTGSSSGSGNGGSTISVASGPNGGLLNYLIGASLPNLRFGLPLNIDSRHNLVANVDYSYAQGEGPEIAGRRIFQNAGINLVFRARSGEPYTRYEFPAQKVVYGGAQGSRLPWHYMLDARIEKSFALSFNKNEEEGINRNSRLGLKAFVYVTNLLNTKDVLGVYGYTGRPDDNGYISSSIGQTDAASRANPQSFMDLYNLSRIEQYFVNNPRRINIGLSLTF